MEVGARECSAQSQLQAAYTREILTFLHHCKSGQAAATNEVAKAYLEWREKQSNGPVREALRWFYGFEKSERGAVR